MCEPCRDERRAAKRARHAERRAAGVCVHCAAPAPGGKTYCDPCGEARNKRRDLKAKREADRRRYAERCAAGVCVKCKTPVFGGAAYCAPCVAARNERRDREAEYAGRRQRYADRRASGRCVECDAPSPGVARCEPCSIRHREGSGAFRGIPVHEPQYTVVELGTGAEHGTYDSLADVVLCLAFAKLSVDQVEVIRDAPITASFMAPE